MTNLPAKIVDGTVVEFEDSNKRAVVLSKDIIRRYICRNASDDELEMFLKLCYYQKLNPFLRQAYLIKYGSNPATMVVGWHVFLERAERHPQFNGYEVEVYDAADRPYRGKQGQTINHATARVYRKDRKFPVTVTVLFKEYSTGRSQWSPDKMPATMIRKVAIEQALREAFTKDFEGVYGAEEMKVDPEDLSTEEIVVSPIDGETAMLPSVEAEPEPIEEETPAQAPVKPRVIAPFGVITNLVKLHGAKWASTDITVQYFGEHLKSSKDMEAFAARNPDKWTEGTTTIAEAVAKTRVKS